MIIKTGMKIFLLIGIVSLYFCADLYANDEKPHKLVLTGTGWRWNSALRAGVLLRQMIRQGVEAAARWLVELGNGDEIRSPA